MAGNPTNNWWSMMMNGSIMHPNHESQQFSSSSSSSSSSQHFYGSSNFLADINIPSQDFPRSWSQLLLSGLSGEQEKSGMSHFHQYKKLQEKWEEVQSLNSINPSSSCFRVPVVDVKPQVVGQVLYSNYQDFPAASSPANSCVTTNLSHDILNFSGNKITSKVEAKHQHPDHSSECNSTSSGGVTKKARVQHSSAQPSLKVRKEKLGDRITALHQLVSPFGKTDTASVLSEAIGYIRFLQGQIQALSSPYMGNVAGSMGHTHQQSDSQHRVKDLRSRGLCLVPISCTQHVGNDTVGDYWAPALGGGYL
ncbi:PREDICTED: transcription factor bHLH68-like isoform X2 [Nicotiana attenuata]|uniref:transcription factor bHLH68-like isoform X2 n=1 Tax=Nicotiana attenuata TaxID=49451 RepID=UPI000904A005|nr:PREDICTED: transcription factor bHLH68-like isoform X2 [Nicotiana attenuata]